ncbi:MAG: PspC domain-containing protein [Rhodothermales bacterium]
MRKLRKTSHDKMVAGVCGGIAEYFGIDATLVRVGYVVLSVLSTGFPGLLVYIILAFVMPDN